MADNLLCSYCAAPWAGQAVVDGKRACTRCAATERRRFMAYAPLDRVAVDLRGAARADAAEAELYLYRREQVRQRGLDHFLEWLLSAELPDGSKIALCTSVPLSTPGGVTGLTGWSPLESLEGVGDKLLAAYFGIDLDAVERHRKQILKSLGERQS